MKENFQTLLTIKRLGINGEGIGYYKRKAVFVEGALPEEEVVCEFEKEENTYVVAKTVKLRKRSEHRVDAPCPYFGRCGGCQLQHIDYKQQLKYKRDIIIQALERYVHNYEELNIEIKDMIGMEDPYNYRNKAQMPAAFDGEKVVTGLYEANTNRLIHIDKCIIQDNTINSIIYFVKTLMMKYRVMVFSRKFNDGVVRYITVRYIKDTNEAQVVLVLKDKDLSNITKLANDLMAKHKEVVSFYVNINSDLHTHEIYGEEYIHITGKKTMDALIGKSKFILSPHSFFQLNSEQCKVMYDIIKETAQLKPSYKVIDAYCGAGTIGIYIADSVESVRGVDITEQAINDAKNNAAINELQNTLFEAGHAEEVIPKWIDEGFKADVIILDPPRTGIETSLLSVLRRVKIKKMVYVSCNPSTLAKDLNELRKVYHIKTIQPIDMFPQTSHVESVVYLVRK